MMSTSLLEDYLNPVGNTELFTDQQWWRALLRFESALAQAQAECGILAPDTAAAIKSACTKVEFDRERFTARARVTGALGMALVEPLREWLRREAPAALPGLHWGTTTQDAVDTAHALLTQDALQALLAELDALVQALRRMARRYAKTPMLARSLMQPAQLTTFGFKCAQSAWALQRSVDHLRQLAPSALCVQLGGAVGNRAALGEHGDRVERIMADSLGLSACGHSWHTQRDAWMRLAMEAAICAGSLAKLARDWSLMSQSEVGELSEGARGRTSSAMPHKRNAVHCMQAVAQTQTVPGLAAALLGTMAQAHERALGEWQAEVAQWAPLWRRVHGAAAALRMAAQGLQVDEARMLAHIQALQEVVFSEGCAEALTPMLGPDEAQAVVERLAAQALTEQRPLSRLLLDWLAQTQGQEALQRTEPALHAAVAPDLAAAASTRACDALLAALASGTAAARFTEGRTGRPDEREKQHV